MRLAFHRFTSRVLQKSRLMNEEAIRYALAGGVRWDGGVTYSSLVDHFPIFERPRAGWGFGGEERPNRLFRTATAGLISRRLRPPRGDIEDQNNLNQRC